MFRGLLRCYRWMRRLVGGSRLELGGLAQFKKLVLFLRFVLKKDLSSEKESCQAIFLFEAQLRWSDDTAKRASPY